NTADAAIAEQKRAAMVAELEAQRTQDGTRKRESVQKVRKVARVTDKQSRTFPAVAERFWTQQQLNGIKTWKEQRSMLQRHVIPQWTADIAGYSPQSIKDLVGELDLAHQTRLHIFSTISGVFETAVLAGFIEHNPCSQVK